MPVPGAGRPALGRSRRGAAVRAARVSRRGGPPPARAQRIAKDVTELVGGTPLVRLKKLEPPGGARLVAKLESMEPCCSVKDRIGYSMINNAEQEGKITPGKTTLVEPTSGNTGIGLALVGNALGYRSVIVIPETQSEEKKDMLRLAGAELVQVPAAPYKNPNNYVKISGRLAEQMNKSEPNGAIWANQFDNVANRQAHVETTGPEIWADTDGEVDFVVHLLPSDVARLSRDESFKVYKDESAGLYYGAFNAGEKSVLNDVRIRKAVNLLVDRELAVGRSELTFVWKIWTIEAVDFCTILYGAIDYAAAERRRNAVLGVAPPPGLFDPWGGLWAAPWRAWSPALRVYVAAFAANAVLFGGLASGLLARALTAREDEHVVGRAGYMFVATYVFALDAVTDLPVWFASLVTRAYVHNLYLTFNVVINLLALVRGIYICLVACLLPLGPPPRLLGPDADPALYGATRAASSSTAPLASGFVVDSSKSAGPVSAVGPSGRDIHVSAATHDAISSCRSERERQSR